MKTVIIIDDDVNINNLLYELFSKNNYNVLRAWSGTEGKWFMKSKNPT